MRDEWQSKPMAGDTAGEALFWTSPHSSAHRKITCRLPNEAGMTRHCQRNSTFFFWLLLFERLCKETIPVILLSYIFPIYSLRFHPVAISNFQDINQIYYYSIKLSSIHWTDLPF